MQSLRSILSQRLIHSGYDVLEAADGEEAIDVFREHGDSIGCVLLDVSMPKRNGDEVERELHALGEDILIVLMSGYNEEELGGRFREAKIASRLQKPIEAEALLTAIREAMARR
jgi:CheY-like chemotaxis protein